MRAARSNDLATAAVMDHLIRRECARADRNGQAFSLVLFRVQGQRNSKTAHRLARTMLKRVRLTDDVGWVDARHLGALLPDTSPAGAKAFADGVIQAVSRHAPTPRTTIYAYPRDHEAMNAVTAPRPSLNRSLRLNFKGYALEHSPRRGAAPAPAAPAPAANAAGVAGPRLTMARDESPAPASAGPTPQAPPASDADAVANVEDLLSFPMPFWKRTIDIVGSATLLMLLSPMLFLAALAIRLSSPGPIIFRQRRAGLGGRPFTIFKFRTMVIDAEKRQQELRRLNEQDGPAFKLTRDPRVTRVGAFLRKTSIDELPQLLNVLKGEMSLVGPRPLPITEQDGCAQWQRHRLNVTPGLTCIWQVKGRSQVCFSDWVRMDVEYIRRRTALHDLKILAATVPSVLLRKGAR